MSMKNYIILGLLSLVLFSCTQGKGAICNDGWRSHSTGSGTCSWHDGVDHYLDPNEIDVGKTVLLIIVIVIIGFVMNVVSRNN
jgi:hypothetical protein